MLHKTVVEVKRQQDKHQKAIEIITQQLIQLSEAAKEIIQLSKVAKETSQCVDSRNKDLIPNGGMISFPKQMRLEFPRFDREDPTSWIYKTVHQVLLWRSKL